MFNFVSAAARVLAFTGTFGANTATAAEMLPAPEGEVLLTVRGAIEATNVDGNAAFDLQMLQSMAPTTFETTTVWTDGPQQFTGVTLVTLMDALGVDGGTLKASAINDYTVEIPVSDAVEGGPIVAYMRNGEEMSVRDKGPLWIVYPYDANADYQSEQTYARSIWQLDRIEVVE